jgi:serine-type D-Ala-D-Ala carboxypeptidase/endopeptidase
VIGALLLAATVDVAAVVRNKIAATPGMNAPGIAIAVSYENAPTFVYRGVGRVGGPPVDGDTIFELGSVTKSFTAIMLGAAVSQGIGGVTLADRPARWVAFAGDPNQTAPNPVGTSCLPKAAAPVLEPQAYGTFAQMTLEELATHTSGLPRVPPAPYGEVVERQCYSPRDLMNFIEGGRFTPPPAPYLYSNIGFGALGYVLQGIYGGKTSWLDLAREHILDPLGMTHTYAFDVPTAAQPFQAQGYRFPNGRAVAVQHWTWNPWPAAGALQSTAPDMMQFLLLSMGQTGSPALRAGVALSQKPHVQIGGGAWQALSWTIAPLDPDAAGSGEVIAKDGGTNGFSAWIGVVRFLNDESRAPIGIVVLTNGTDRPVGKLGKSILTALAASP